MDGFPITDGWVDLTARSLVRGATATRLTSLEARLLQRLAEAPGEPVGHAALLRDVWGQPASVNTQSVEQAVRRVRVKLEVDPRHPSVLLTDRGLGYRLVLPTPSGPELAPARDTVVGREAERSTLEAWLDRGTERLLTLTGIGGIGKTRLAREFALDHCQRLVGFVDLTAAQVAEHLAPSAAGLLVLDNAELAIDAVAERVAHWLDTAPGVRILVTSRERLGVPGERVLRLGPLPSRHASLHARHASLSQLGYPEALAALASDPGALEAARAEVPNLLAAAAAALDHAPDEARPLVGALAALLAEDDPAGALNWVNRLGERSMEADAVRWAGLCIAAGRPDEALAELQPWGDSGGVALARAQAHLRLDALEEAERWVAVALAQLEPGRRRGEALDLAASVDARLGRFEASALGHERALRSHQRSGDTAASAHTLARLAAAAHRAGDRARAAGLYQRAADTAERFGRRGTQVEALAALAGVQVYAGEARRAVASARRAVGLAEPRGNPDLQGQAWAALGEACVYADLYDEAADALARAREAAALADRPFLLARVDCLLGELLRRRGELPGAAAALERAIGAFVDQGQALATTIAWCRRGLLWLAESDPVAARRCQTRATQAHAPRGRPTHPAVCFELGRLRRALA